MSSTYGATGESHPSLSPQSSIDLHGPDDDDEYDYLPIPEVDANYLDPSPGGEVLDRRRQSTKDG